MEKELISVIMSAYNEREEWLRKSIESILKQTYENIELILILDKPDNEKLRSVIEEYQKKDFRLIFIPNEENIGLVESLNKALTYVKGTYVARMDADDISYTDRLEKQMKTLQESGADFVMSAIDILYEDGSGVAGKADEAFGAEQVAEVMKYGNIAHHPTWLMKKEVYDNLEGYRNVSYCEDMEFVLRALQKGYRLVKSSDHVVRYRVREGSVSKSYTMEQAMKAQYLRKKYAAGMELVKIPEEELNRRFSGYTENQKQKFQNADRMLELFCQNMAEGHWGGCIMYFSKGFLGNMYFRRLFIEFLKSFLVRKRLAGKGI